MQKNRLKLDNSNKEEKHYETDYLILIDAIEFIAECYEEIGRFDYKFIQDNYSCETFVTLKQGYNKIYKVNDEICLEKVFSTNKKYHEHYYVHISGHKAAHLFTFRGQRSNHVKIKIDSRYRYTHNFLDGFKQIIESLPLFYNSVCYMEIAYDSNSDTTGLFADHFLESEKLKHAKRKKFKHVGGAKIDVFRGSSFIVGVSDYKKIALYNKSEEIKANDKDFINDYHERHGLKGEIHRVEVRLRKKFLKDLEDETSLEKLEDQDYLKRLFVTSVGKNLTFKDTEDYVYDSNRNKKNKLIHVLDTEKISKDKIKIYRPAVNKQAKHKRDLDKIQSSILSMISDEILAFKNTVQKSGESVETIRIFEKRALQISKKAIAEAAKNVFWSSEDFSWDHPLFRVDRETQQLWLELSLQHQMHPVMFLEKTLLKMKWCDDLLLPNE